MIHIWHWILNFTGINYGQNSFATHMYNFWSGFGGDITEFAIVGTLITIYRHHLKNSRIIEDLVVRKERKAKTEKEDN
jgi:hypothetical protein